MKINLLLLISVFMLLVGCSNESSQPNPARTLQLSWETHGFSNPESVVYDEKRDRLYVSNVNGSPVEKDGKGSISIVSMNGDIVEEEWIVGLDSPKGLALYEDKLYVADIDELVEIDIKTRLISNSYLASDSKFLNDVTASPTGDIYVSDMLTNRIYRLHNKKMDMWLETSELESPNGLFAQKDNLVLGAWGVMTDGFATKIPGHLKLITYKDKKVSSLGSGSPTGNLDGVESDDNGNYYVTDWMAGKLLLINQNGTANQLLQLEQGMADLEVINNKQMIVLPMMNSNKLLAYRIK